MTVTNGIYAKPQSPGGGEHPREVFMRQPADHVDVRVLAAASNEDHTVPADARFCVFSANADFYAKSGGTAAVPGADVTDGSGSELNPTQWDVSGVTTIGLIAPAATVITMSYYL